MPKKRAIAKRGTRTPIRSLPIQNRIAIAWKNLLLFLVLFIISYIFYKFFSEPLIVNLFGLLLIISGFLAFAFFIILMVLVILKSERR